MADYTVLPIRFDCVAPNPRCVREQLLKARHKELSALLDAMEGRMETGLEGVLVRGRRLAGDRPATTRPSVACAMGWRAALSRETYYDRIRLGELVEAELKTRRAGDAELVLQRLRPLAQKTQVNATIARPHGVEFRVPDRAGARGGIRRRRARTRCGNGARLLIKCVGPGRPIQFRECQHAVGELTSSPAAAGNNKQS